MTINSLLLVTDAWAPMMNGVVTTLDHTVSRLTNMGIRVDIIHPYLYDTFKLPMYKDIAIPYNFTDQLSDKLYSFTYDSVHIAVEGRLGWNVRRWMNNNGLKYTTAFHTNFPMYLDRYYHIPPALSHAIYFRWFHKDSCRIMTPTPGMVRYLQNNHYQSVALWSRGVDSELFNSSSRTDPQLRNQFMDKFPVCKEQYILYVGRISSEKNIEAFLNIKTSFRKIVVGDGPQRHKLEKRYPNATFVGVKTGKDLAGFYANAECFVFPSITDTFGLVMIEALACGTPVAAPPAPNTNDILSYEVGFIDNDLELAVKVAMMANREACEQYVHSKFTWERCTRQFYNNLVEIV